MAERRVSGKPSGLGKAVLLGGLFLAVPAGSREPAESARPEAAAIHRNRYPGAPLLLRLPVVDWPYGSRGRFDSPAMQQSLHLSAGSIQWADQSIGWAWERNTREGPLREWGTWLSLALFDYLFTYLPPGGGWLHEEWHRAVLTRRGVSSYNGVYHWDIGAEAIAVDHVSDADLADMKRDHNPDFVRLMEAGVEGETESGRLMRRNNFFLGRSSRYDLPHLWVSGLNGALYIYLCSNDFLDGDLAAEEEKETAQGSRDFTGLDFRAWVYDLRHPDEAYAAGPRGRPHPAGSGFRRYLRAEDLSASERDYLRLQAGLNLLNFVSPQMWGRDWLPGRNPWDGRGFLWNFGLVHHLTPFGYDLGADFLLRRGKWAWAFSLQAMVNGEMPLPGVSGELFRYPLSLGRLGLFLNAGASAWLQPEGLAFRSGDPVPGGGLSLGAALPVLGGLEWFVEGDAKTDGWVAGNVYLESSAQGRTGLQWRL